MALKRGATAPARERAVMWVTGCPVCGTVDLDSIWPRPDLVQPRAWRCPECLGATWEPVAVPFPI